MPFFKNSWKKLVGIYFLVTFALSNLFFNLFFMETVVIQTRNKSDARLLRNMSKRIGANIIEPVDLLVDRSMCRLKEQNILEPDVDEIKLVKALKDFAKQNNLSAHIIGVDDFLEEYEDFVFGCMMEENKNDPDNSEYIDESIIMEFLRNR